jgi:hypothetical protein
VYVLVRLAKEYEDESPDDSWEDYYAPRLIEHFKT